jgi:hypothetical protein
MSDERKKGVERGVLVERWERGKRIKTTQAEGFMRASLAPVSLTAWRAAHVVGVQYSTRAFTSLRSIFTFSGLAWLPQRRTLRAKGAHPGRTKSFTAFDQARPCQAGERGVSFV